MSSAGWEVFRLRLVPMRINLRMGEAQAALMACGWVLVAARHPRKWVLFVSGQVDELAGPTAATGIDGC